ncbi:hypothetical protein COB64_04565 [Candidatus Wolfebacteria bacterium]|nr:MAG: hypothetical protein COB64_04565 [Candidatus Wolfebacteria bacterium]
MKFNETYTKHETPFGKEADLIVKNILKHIESGNAIDLGAGQGRNSLFLASHGFSVEAVDSSSVAIQKIKEQSKKENIKIDAHVSDISELELSKEYDAIISTLVLHHLASDKAISLIENIKEHTKVGGVNVITLFTKEGDFYTIDKEKGTFYADRGQLKDMYSDWEIIEYFEREGKAHAKKSDGSPMFNISAGILAKKIG